MDPKKALVVSDDEEDVPPRYPIGPVFPMEILPKSTHRDGSIYKGSHIWKRDYHVMDRNETRMVEPTDCDIHNGTCTRHTPTRMLQIFSLKLAELVVNAGSLELYGYIAVRDDLDPLLNYVVNASRDDPLIVEQGSFINMAGPKRGIDLYGSVLVEYDMKIKRGEQEKNDMQLIDGVSAISDLGGTWNRAFTKRIHGDCGAIDLTVSRIHGAVQATVEVLISQVQSNFKLCLRCFIGGYNEEIGLFDGAINSCALRRYVVAVVKGSTMDLNFKVASDSSSSAEHCCSFKADTHGFATQDVKADFGLISVKVAWSTLLS